MLGVVSPLLSSIPGVSHRFFTRHGGTSPHPWRSLNTSFDVSDSPGRVEENLARVRFQIGVRKDCLFACTQVHGKDVVVVGEGDDPLAYRAAKADGLVTRAPEIAVAVRTADCAPILLAVDDGSAVAALHAGWRGAVGGIIEEGVKALAVEPSKIVAAVGPTISFDAFEVGPEVIDAAKSVVSVEGISRAGEGDRFRLDLAAFVLRVLERCGVTRMERVGVVDDDYFSHRRDKGVTGRQMSAIARTNPPNL